jgi:phosphate transport system substrate-binding protein
MQVIAAFMFTGNTSQQRIMKGNKNPSAGHRRTRLLFPCISGKYPYLMSLQIVMLFLVIASCSSSSDKNKPEKDTPTSGTITFYADESFQPLLSSATLTFQHTYKNASLHINYTTEAEALSRFLSFQSPVIIIPRMLSKEELKDYYNKGYKPEQYQFATDAVVFVINNRNPDSLVTYNQMLKIISGKYNNWNRVDNDFSGDMSIIFDKNNSSTASYLIDSILHKQPLPSNCYAVSSNSEVMNYVRMNPKAMGVLALNWVSDKDDPEVIEALKGLTIIAVSSTDDSTLFYKPIAKHLQAGMYPFIRPLYLVNCEGHNGLGTGFADYLASDKGQTIIRLFDLLPINEPSRVIEIRKSF